MFILLTYDFTAFSGIVPCAVHQSVIIQLIKYFKALVRC